MAVHDPIRAPILLITDLSARCDRAMDRAAALAKSHGVRLIALHVVETPWLTKLADPTWRNMLQDSTEFAKQRLTDDPALADVDLTVLVEPGNPLEVIEQVAKTNHCSLIVSGTARDETLGRIVLGNTVERLARRTPTPFLVVRSRPFTAYQNIVVATDFSDGASQALAYARTVCPSTPMTLYHAFDQIAGIYELDSPTVAEETEALRARTKQFGQSTLGLEANKFPIVIEHGAADHCLPEYVKAHRVELVVMGTHGATGVSRTAMGSIAEKLLSRVQCDVLLVPHANR
ncbi:universal stress protein [Orrella daihaiensis]|uniref:Universal stress protein n=1 Tax=Orrella daihaiensis TaxID=2782176 RepID=A0ABY4AIW0_9BURK|nr:universal stress protein [Orrella daihaiensis]UOD50226.1 universal stress protein [Orrella daihaiensis]